MRFSLDDNNLSLSSLRDFFRMGAEVVYDSETALVLRFGGIYYGAGECDRCEEYRESLMALCVDHAACERLVEAKHFDDVTPVWQYVYTGEMPPEPKGNFTINRLTVDDVSFLLQHYSHPGSTLKHMTERVTEGLMLGIFRGETCMGFAGLHEEGAIGMLEILPEYRRQGLATALILTLVRIHLSVGRVPYTHVYPTNTVSMKLQEKLGFVRAEETVVWLCKHDAYTTSSL